MAVNRHVSVNIKTFKKPLRIYFRAAKGLIEVSTYSAKDHLAAGRWGEVVWTCATMHNTWLGKQGFQISTAGDLSKAHKLLEHQSYDLILSDLRLPEGDGLSLLDWMQKHGLVVPLIVMTSYADVQNAVNAMKQGACDYIAKPVQPAMLLVQIEDALSASSPPVA